MRANLGFSLFEVVTILAVIAILGIMAYPAYLQIGPSIHLNSSIKQLAGDLRQAQQLAVEQQINHSAVFNLEANSYTINNDDSGQVIISRVLTNLTIQEITGLTNNTLTFTVTGGVLESGSLTLENVKGQVKILEIKPSGYVKI